jgi:uncharacterized protein YprB with RNaseH-like and TPR domain
MRLFFMGRKELSEVLGWIFVNHVPLLYEKRRVAKQLQIETWLDLSQLVKELGIEKTDVNKQNANATRDYII